MMMQQPNQYFEQLGADKDLGNRALILRPAPDVKHLPPDHLSPAAPCSLVEELHSCPPPLSQVFGQAIEISARGTGPLPPEIGRTSCSFKWVSSVVVHLAALGLPNAACEGNEALLNISLILHLI